MPSSAGSGIFMGLSAAERRREGGSGKGGGMYNLFPKLLIAIIAYAALAYGSNLASETAFTGTMDAFVEGNCEGMEGAGPDAIRCHGGLLYTTLFKIGDMPLTWSDLLIIFGLVLLFLEMLKAPGTGNATVFNNLLSTGVFVIAILLLVMNPLFATSTFLIITMMAAVDVGAGWFITVIASRRDLAVGGE